MHHPPAVILARRQHLRPVGMTKRHGHDLDVLAERVGYDNARNPKSCSSSSSITLCCTARCLCAFRWKSFGRKSLWRYGGRGSKGWTICVIHHTERNWGLRPALAVAMPQLCTPAPCLGFGTHVGYALGLPTVGIFHSERLQ